MSNITLDPRLQLVADAVRQGARFADVGTDHAYLPLALLDMGRLSFAVASDVAEGPLAFARENLREAGREGELTLICTDGLQGMEGLGLTDISICGMGGELIAAILAAAPFVKSPAVRLYLQPMSRAESLRYYLAEEGFAVLCERYAVAAGRPYACLVCEYTGIPRKIGHAEAMLGDPAVRDARDAAPFAALLDLREREALRRIRGRRMGGADTEADELLLAAIAKERERVL